MKPGNEIRVLLKMTQQDIAGFLGVSRSHYSMYELGKRDLPLKATQLLATLLTQAQVPKKLTKGLAEKESRRQRTQRQESLERILRENEYQQLSISKKIAAATNKHETNAKRLRLVSSLPDEQHKLSEDGAKINAIMGKASKKPEADRTEELLKLEIRQEVLVFEQSLLETKLREVM